MERNYCDLFELRESFIFEAAYEYASNLEGNETDYETKIAVKAARVIWNKAISRAFPGQLNNGLAVSDEDIFKVAKQVWDK